MKNHKLLAVASFVALMFATSAWADALTKAANAAAAIAWGVPGPKSTSSITINSQGNEAFMRGAHQVATNKDGSMALTLFTAHDAVHDLLPAGLELTFDPSVATKRWEDLKFIAAQIPADTLPLVIPAPLDTGVTYDTKTNLPKPAFISTGWDHRSCLYEGTFLIANMTVEYKVFGTGEDAVWGIHPVGITATWTSGCSEETNPNGTSFGKMIFNDTKKDGTFTPPPYTTGTGTGGGGGGGDTGGGGTGGTTPPPTTTPPDITVSLPANVFDEPVVLANGDSTQIPFSIVTANSFKADVTLSAFSEPAGLNVQIAPPVIPAPGVGAATLIISAGPDVFPQDYRIFVVATANDITYLSSFVMTVGCNPPFILGIDQPAGVTVRRGDLAHLSVKASGGGPYHYQWYIGHAGQTLFPMPSGTSAAVTTPVISDNTEFWVRVWNACGSAESQTVTVTALKTTSTGRLH
jgi:hypothetical protein